MTGMAAVDIFILLVIGISCLIGVFRGLIKEALSLVFWIGAIIAAGLFSTAAGAWLSDFIASPMLQRVTAFVLIFVLVVFVGGLISNGISHLLSKAGLGAADRALGAMFGLVRGVAIVTVVVMLTARLSFTQQVYSESQAMPYVMTMADWLQDRLGITPASLEESVEETVKNAAAHA
jgi:membrane protein required for colicin V production